MTEALSAAPATQVIVMTAGQLRELATEIAREAVAALSAQPAPRAEARREYVYGIRGIRNLFDVSHSTAQHYKNTFLRPAVTQRGRKIAVDVEMARRLFDEHNRQ